MAQQNNDTFIEIIDSPDFGLVDATEIVYVLMSENRQQKLITKTLGDGIEKGDNKITVTLSAADTANLNKVYYEELKMKNVLNEVNTVYKGTREFEPTYITEF